MFCPKCKCEYRDGFTTCPNCNVNLIAQLPVDFHKDSKHVHPVIVKSVNNETDAQLVMNLLRINHINCFRKSRGGGEIMRIYMGYSVYGEDIYVDKKDYQTALNLLNAFTDNQESIDEIRYSPHDIAYYRNPRNIARITIIVTNIIYVLFCILS